MSIRSRENIVGIEEFLGRQDDVEKSMRQGSQKDQNVDMSVEGRWTPRPGLADSGLTDGTNKIMAVGWGRGAIKNVLLLADDAGNVMGYDMPTPDWTTG